MKENKNNLAEGFGTGVIDQVEDKRDIAFSAVTPFDWELGFDIELLLGFRKWCGSVEKFFDYRGREGWGVERYREIVQTVRNLNIQPIHLKVKNQGVSSSCTGQALAYYLEVLNFIETGEYKSISARDAYAYISIGEGRGAYLRDALALTVNRGIGTEKLVPCYEEFVANNKNVKNPYTEKQYMIKPDETEELGKVRATLQSLEYQSVQGHREALLENMAWAMLMGLGVYFAVNGQNGKGWLTEYPQVPEFTQWQHALYGGKAMIDSDGEKTLGHINSWGTCGVNGWQKLKMSYFEGYNVTNPWTLIDKSNNWNMTKSNIKIIKDSNSPAVGIWLPALSPEALESYCKNFGIDIPRNAKGEVDWDKWIDGTMQLNK